MSKRVVAKVFLAIFETLSAICVLLLACWAIHPVRDFFTVHLPYISQFVEWYHPENWLGIATFEAYPDLYGLLLGIIVLVVLQLCTIGPLIVLNKKPKAPKNALAPDDFEHKEGAYVSSFVDRKGNFGKVQLDKAPEDIRTKYFAGLNETQADQEFDWHNYAGVKPAVRIVFGVVLTILALAFLVLRFGWYVRDANEILGTIYADGGFLATVESKLDYPMNYLFGTFKDVSVGTIGSCTFTAQYILDFLLWFAGCYALVLLLLAAITGIAWCFRKPAAVKKARLARERYYRDLANGVFAPRFDEDEIFTAAAVVSPKEMRGENLSDKVGSNIEPAAVSDSKADEAISKAASIADLGTGVLEVKPLQINVEGNIIDHNVVSYTLSSGTDDILLIDTSLIGSISTFTRRNPRVGVSVSNAVSVKTIATMKPRKKDFVKVEEPAKMPTAADMLPAHWYLLALDNPALRPSSYWYPEIVAQPETVEEKPVAPTVVAPTIEEEVVPASFDVEETPLYRLLANALEPYCLHPVGVPGSRQAPKPIEESFRLESTKGYVEQPAPVEEPEQVVETAETIVTPTPIIAAPSMPLPKVEKRVIRPSERLVDFWLTMASLQAKHPYISLPVRQKIYVSGLGFTESVLNPGFLHAPSEVYPASVEEGLLRFLEPDLLLAAEVEGAKPLKEYEKTLTPVAVVPTYSDIAANKTPDYWYDRAYEEAQTALPFVFVPMPKPVEPVKPVVAPVVAPIGVTPVYTDRASDKTPDYWYALAGETNFGMVSPIGEVIAAQEESVMAPFLPVEKVESKKFIASQMRPAYWFTKAVHEIYGEKMVLPVAPTPVHVAYVSGWISGLVSGEVSLAQQARVSGETTEQMSLVSGRYGNLASGYVGSGYVSGLSGGVTYWVETPAKPIEAQASVEETLREKELKQFIESSALTPVEIEGVASTVRSAVGEEERLQRLTASAIASAPVYTHLAATKTPDYWYDRAYEESQTAAPFFFIPYVPTKKGLASDRKPAYWFDKAISEFKEAEPFVFAPMPKPVEPVKPVVAPVVAPIGVVPVYTDRASDKTPDYWYALAGETSLGAVAPIGEASAVESLTAPVLPVEGVEPRKAAASEMLPAYWFTRAVHEIYGEKMVLPVAPAPVHVAYASGWISGLVSGEVSLAQQARVSGETTEQMSLVSGRYGNLASGFIGSGYASGYVGSGYVSGLSGGVTYWVETPAQPIETRGAVEETLREKELKQFIEPSALTPVEIEGVASTTAQSAVGEEERLQRLTASAIASAPVYTHLAATKTPDYWYDRAYEEAQTALPFVFTPMPVEEEISDTPADKTPDYWYSNVKLPAKTVVKPVAPIGIRKPVTPIKPVSPMKKAEEEKKETEHVIRGPIGLAHAKSKPAAVGIKPVAARKVRFQLKTIGATYNGKLTPEEAFNMAVTTQSVVVNPIYANQTNAGSRYLNKRKEAEKAKAQKSGYVSAVVVKDLKEDEIKKPVETFSEPVSAYPSIREWKKAKKAWEEAHKARQAEQATATTEQRPDKTKIKPIQVVKPMAKPEETKVKPQIKKVEPIKPIAPLKPVKPGTPIKPIKPIKPISPIKIDEKKKKGE